MAKEEHKARKGFITFLKIILIIIFMACGAALITIGAININKGRYASGNTLYKAVVICIMVFGGLLFLSPVFLKQEREGGIWVIKVLIVVVFIIFGSALLTCSAIDYSTHPDPAAHYQEVVSMAFGALVLTSPILLLA